MSSTSPAIGIDLGTTYSCVGVWLQQHNRVEIIANDYGNRITHSCVSFSDERLVGDKAFDDAAYNPTNTIYDVKRLMGRRFSDPSVQNDMKLWPFTVVSGPNDKPLITVEYKGMVKRFCPEEISAMVLAKMKEIAEIYLGCTVKNVVVTVPAHFNGDQRRSTIDAGSLAGLNVQCIMDEPIAAAVAYGLDNSNNRYVLVFDLGGGTFDVSLLSNVNGTFRVKATSRDSHLGDEAFHKPMINYCTREFKRRYGKDISGDRKALLRLNNECERAKITLLSQPHATISVDYLYKGIDFTCRISQSRYDELNADLYNRCINLVEECIGEAQIVKQDIGEVVLVGGSTRIPKVQYLLQEYFPEKRICREIDPDEVIAYGATIMAEKLSGQLGTREDVLQFEKDNARKNDEEKLALQFELSEAQKLIEKAISERDDAHKLIDELLTSERDIARKEDEEKAAIQFKLSEAQKLIKQLTSERENARKEVEEKAALQFKLSEAQKLVEKVTSERNDARKEVEGRVALRFELSESQQLVEQLKSERDNVNKEVEEKAAIQFELSEAQKLIEKVMSERDDARKEVEEKAALQLELSEAQKLIEKVTSQRDNARKEVEEKAALQFKLSEAQKLIEQLTSERDNARKCWNIVLQRIWPLI